MVFTLFHYPLAYVIYKASRRKLAMYDVVFGSFMVDLEIPILFILGFEPSRLVLHSLLGSLLFSIPIALFFYPITSKTLSLFDIRVPKRPKSLLSIVIGAESHVFLDLFNHEQNPLFWLIRRNLYVGLLVFNDLLIANIVMHTIMITATALIFVKLYQRNGEIARTIESMLIDP